MNIPSALAFARASCRATVAFGITLSCLVFFAPRVLGASTPAFVQENNTQANSGTTATTAFSRSTTAGNLIVAYVIWDHLGTVRLSDTAGNTYINAVGPTLWS